MSAKVSPCTQILACFGDAQSDAHTVYSSYVSTGEPICITIVAAFLRLGRKYDISILRDEAAKRIFYEYPSTLAEYDAKDSYFMISQSAWTEVDVTNVAREQGLLSVLPVALYGCCFTIQDAITLAAGILRNDGTTAKLSPNNNTTCLIAYQSLAALQASTTFSWINGPIARTEAFRACTSCQQCTMIRTGVMRDVFLPSATISGLCSWGELQEKHELDHMCLPCQGLAEKLHNEGRIKFWNALPGVLGLPEWEELKKERE